MKWDTRGAPYGRRGVSPGALLRPLARSLWRRPCPALVPSRAWQPRDLGDLEDVRGVGSQCKHRPVPSPQAVPAASLWEVLETVLDSGGDELPQAPRRRGGEGHLLSASLRPAVASASRGGRVELGSRPNEPWGALRAMVPSMKTGASPWPHPLAWPAWTEGLIGGREPHVGRSIRSGGQAARTGPGTLRVSCAGVGETRTADGKQGGKQPSPWVWSF